MASTVVICICSYHRFKLIGTVCLSFLTPVPNRIFFAYLSVQYLNINVLEYNVVGYLLKLQFLLTSGCKFFKCESLSSVYFYISLLQVYL